MQSDSVNADTEDFTPPPDRRRGRLLAAIAILLIIGPASCQTMIGPVWGRTDDQLLNAWYERTKVLVALIFFFGPPLLLLANRFHHWLSRGVVRWQIIGVQWTVTGIFFLHFDNPWRQIITTDWQGKDFLVVEHPIFNSCFYLSVLLSGILWITFRGDRRWLFRVLYEFLPFALLIAGRLYLSSLDPPDFNWG